MVALALVKVHEVRPALELQGRVGRGGLGGAGEEGDGQTGVNWPGLLRRIRNGHARSAVHIRHVDRAGERQTRDVLTDGQSTRGSAGNLVDRQGLRGR